MNFLAVPRARLPQHLLDINVRAGLGQESLKTLGPHPSYLLRSN